MSTGSPPVQLYDPLYGSLYFSALISTAFYGITCMQTFFCYVNYQNDLLRMKIFVAAIWALNTIHEALVVAGVWKYILNGLTNPSSFEIIFPELIFQMLLTTVAAINTQGFFVYRIYVLSRKNIVAPVVWVILTIIQLAALLIYYAKAPYRPSGIPVLQFTALTEYTFVSLLTVNLSVAAGVDVLIAIFLTFILVRKRIATGFASTAHILQHLTALAVNTGIWTAVFALLTIILFHVFPSYMFFALFGIPLCSVYCNTLLANLNARAYVRGEALTHNADGDLFTESSSPGFASTGTGNLGGEARMIFSAPRGVWKTTNVAAFPDANWSTTLENTARV